MEKRVIWAVCLMSLAALLMPCCYAQNLPQDYLAAHNSARDKVGVSNLAWDDTLAASAQVYALSVACAVNLATSASGRNVEVGDGSLTGSAAVGSWLSQEVNYDYATNSCHEGTQCNLYTQVVWSGSTSVGCSRVPCAVAGSSTVVVACMYNPPGNIPGIKPY